MKKNVSYVDNSIKKYSDLVIDKSISTDSLLLGNGFSMGIWEKFGYTSLFDNRKEQLNEEDLQLFTALNTTNYEEVLANLHTAINVNNTFHINSNPLSISYERVKSNLIAAVKDVHPTYTEFEQKLHPLTNLTFRIFSDNIFTTNYDTIAYWLTTKLLSDKKNLVGDFFGEKGKGYLHFSDNNLIQHGLKLYYLHGGLHLFINEENETEKIAKYEKEYLMEAIVESIENNNLPLYVSEGKWETKLKSIKSNRYLNFCYNSLQKLSGDLTIFGHSLDETTDYHIIQAINNSNVENIAFGVYTITDKDLIEAKLKRLFPESNIYIFNSRTFYDSVNIINTFKVLKLLK
ncbi:hypothetical protein CN374_28120 [Bacillus cereus]|uniref:DUF4917 family protein n=1 Tax=Bacillus cereus TaxID=1396 RepID=UPI000BFA2DD9|nr:DUF4917 family protein [Bacillus cereus]PEZ83889.1 hypothetical protein CN374_28120 [Bacillus cereus]PFE48285.1 hypothetical protein CN318_29520 [Bacillus cereus]PFI97828.1 hypothetical protein COI88_26260 [Bacillus cereus]PFL13752.1 hypothetical protein COJ07_29665 [Bacillus cereus]